MECFKQDKAAFEEIVNALDPSRVEYHMKIYAPYHWIVGVYQADSQWEFDRQIWLERLSEMVSDIWFGSESHGASFARL